MRKQGAEGDGRGGGEVTERGARRPSRIDSARDVRSFLARFRAISSARTVQEGPGYICAEDSNRGKTPPCPPTSISSLARPSPS